MAYMRQPIISVVGHVDHGKTSILDYIRQSRIIGKEAGHITQHIGATEVPKKDITQIVDGFIPADKVNVPGLLFIDTPGHKAFTSLRKRGGSISDIGILVVDINEGFKPQTIEAIEILKSMKTPFVVAANKVDKIAGWKSDPNKSLLENINSQGQGMNYKLDEKVYDIVGGLSEYGFDAERFDRVEDFTKKVAVVPVSAATGDGMRELVSTLVGLTQKYMEEKLTIEEESKSRGVILEVKDYKGLGRTYDVILYDGVVKPGDTALALDMEGVQRSRIKSILKPAELKEIRDKGTRFDSIDEEKAASGIKLACPDFEDVKAGMPIVTLDKDSTEEEIEREKELLMEEASDVTFTSDEEGVVVKADTLGSLEAISQILQENDISVRKAQIGKVSKTDIIDTSADLKKNPKNALILNFSQKLDEEINELANNYNVTVISSEIIYDLVDKALEWIDIKEKEINRKAMENLRMPVKLKVLPNCIFRTSNPAIVGVESMGGTLRTGMPLMTSYGKKVGVAKSIKDKNDFKQELKYGEEAAVSITDMVVGRHAQEDSELFTFMGEENFRQLKKNKELLSKDEVETLKEIAEIMRKEDSLWGL